MTLAYEDSNKPKRNKFFRHTKILIWKCYLQRQRRWRLLVLETVFAAALFLCSIFSAKPVFLTSLQAEPSAPLSSEDLMATVHNTTLFGYAPNRMPYTSIMQRAADMLNLKVRGSPTEDDLNNILYNISLQVKGTFKNPVVWILWQPTEDNVWKFSIRSTEVAKCLATESEASVTNSPHLRSGFLGIQVAVSKAIIEHVTEMEPNFEIMLKSMPVSPLMIESNVRRTITFILFCFTLAFIPPVMETVTLVVNETLSRLKRTLRIREVSYSSMYLSWIFYALLTALPISLLAVFTLIVIFRWVHLFHSLVIVLGYVTVMIMVGMIMSMFHNKAWTACVWNILMSLLQFFLAELIVHHKYDKFHTAVIFFMQIFLPPLGLIHVFNKLALLETGKENTFSEISPYSDTLISWCLIVLLYFLILMLLQRTIGQDRAIGGQVSWKTIIFRKVQNRNKLHSIHSPASKERDMLQPVDELVAKAISFRNVYKSIMGVPILGNVTFDVYRGEFTMFYAERIQERMINTLDDLLTGLTYADKGTINILGENLYPSKNYMTIPHMMGYCVHRSALIKDLTVQEHINIYTEICMWRESSKVLEEYGLMRMKKLMAECDLEDVRHVYIENLDDYYKAQLSWALGMLIEPRVLIVPDYMNEPSTFVAVTKDKIMKYRKYITIIKMCVSSLQLEHCDRVFLLDMRSLVFGGTPAYMFFKYGRDYKFRITLRSNMSLADENMDDLLERATEIGATVRAHLGLLLILKVPASPTEAVAGLVKDLKQNAEKYGITSLHISIPDSEEVCKRALHESRKTFNEPRTLESFEALQRLAEPSYWVREKSLFLNLNHLRCTGWKYFSFYIHYRFFFIITIFSSLVAGAFIGLALSSLLMPLDDAALLRGDHLSVEGIDKKTILMMRVQNSPDAISVASSYVMSETNASVNQVKKIVYTALSASQSLKEYLVTRAVDAPQIFVHLYAYGLEVHTDMDKLILHVLYSPLHYDQAAAARSLARAHMALIRHYVKSLNASIQVKDDPLALDLTELRHSTMVMQPPLFIQFLLILTISHIIFLPSKESGLIRHYQSNAMNFSPMKYWFCLYFCDLVLFWTLVSLMSVVMAMVLAATSPVKSFYFSELFVVPFLLIVYGVGCIPQAYFFGLGPRASLNSMAFIIINVVFGEATILAKLLYGNALSYAMNFMCLSPQFNLAYAFVKIKKIFLYNSECVFFKTNNLCTNKSFHKCCSRCGVMQKCYQRMNYLNNEGILMEVLATLLTAVVFMTIILLWEYKVVHRCWARILILLHQTNKTIEAVESDGTRQEMREVIDKMNDIKDKNRNVHKVNTFGEHLLVCDVSLKKSGFYVLHHVYFGLSKGEALALSGLKRHGRLKLCEIVAGIRIPLDGQLWTMSKWNLNNSPHKYSQQVSLSCEHCPLPLWMTVYDALEFIAILRGVPRKHLKNALQDYIEALELRSQADTMIKHLPKQDLPRVNFAAAIIGAPPILVLDECTAYQKFTVQRAMNFILYHLRKKGHAILMSSSSVERTMPVTNRLAILSHGHVFDIDNLDTLVNRYSYKGYTVVIHVKDNIKAEVLFSRYFKNFIINSSTDELINVQLLDEDLDWDTIFEKMEYLKQENVQIYSYVVSAIPVDYIYNSTITSEHESLEPVKKRIIFAKFFFSKKIISPSQEKIKSLKPFEKKYDIMNLRGLPWSIIFIR